MPAPPTAACQPGSTVYWLPTWVRSQVSAGTQAVYCTNLHLSNPTPIEVIGYTSTQTQGGHHLILVLNVTDQPDGPPTPCTQGSALDPRTGSMVYASQIQQNSQMFPPHLGMTLPAHASVMLQTHYIDATPNDLTVSSTVNVVAGQPGSVDIPAAPLLFYDTGLQIPEGASSATGSCIVQTPDPIDVFMLAGHMHSHGTNFVLDFTDTDGGTEQVYQTNVWDSPPEKDFTPPNPGRSRLRLHLDLQLLQRRRRRHHRSRRDVRHRRHVLPGAFGLAGLHRRGDLGVHLQQRQRARRRLSPSPPLP